MIAAAKEGMEFLIGAKMSAIWRQFDTPLFFKGISIVQHFGGSYEILKRMRIFCTRPKGNGRHAELFIFFSCCIEYIPAHCPYFFVSELPRVFERVCSYNTQKFPRLPQSLVDSSLFLVHGLIDPEGCFFLPLPSGVLDANVLSQPTLECIWIVSCACLM